MVSATIIYQTDNTYSLSNGHLEKLPLMSVVKCSVFSFENLHGLSLEACNDCSSFMFPSEFSNVAGHLFTKGTITDGSTSCPLAEKSKIKPKEPSRRLLGDYYAVVPFCS